MSQKAKASVLCLCDTGLIKASFSLPRFLFFPTSSRGCLSISTANIYLKHAGFCWDPVYSSVGTQYIVQQYLLHVFLWENQYCFWKAISLCVTQGGEQESLLSIGLRNCYLNFFKLRSLYLQVRVKITDSCHYKNPHKRNFIILVGMHFRDVTFQMLSL